MTQAASYSFQDIICLVNGVQMTGAAEGDEVISIAPRADVTNTTVGAGGDGVTSLIADRSIDITLKLLGTSYFNNFLQALDTEQASLGFILPIVFFLKDVGGLDLVQADAATIFKRPTQGHGVNVSHREWVLTAVNNIVNTGGHFI